MDEKSVVELINSIGASLAALKAAENWHWDNDPYYVGSDLDMKIRASLTSLENSFAMIRKACIQDANSAT